MLITVHLAHPTMPLNIQNDLPESDAVEIADLLQRGLWAKLTFPAGSTDEIVVNPAFVTHVQLVS